MASLFHVGSPSANTAHICPRRVEAPPQLGQIAIPAQSFVVRDGTRAAPGETGELVIQDHVLKGIAKSKPGARAPTDPSRGKGSLHRDLPQRQIASYFWGAG